MICHSMTDASMAILTIHHWPDREAGLRDMHRVTRGRIVLLTFDPSHRPWLTDYLPELAALDEAQMPTMSDYERWLGSVQITPVPVPHDCSDGFLYAYWRRPDAARHVHLGNMVDPKYTFRAFGLKSHLA
jgi:hypothetical protein